MDGMAHELQACIPSPPEARPSASLGGTSLPDRSADGNVPPASLRTTGSAGIVRARQELAGGVRKAASDLSDHFTFYIHSHESGYRAAELLAQAPFTPIRRAERGMAAAAARQAAGKR
jgi:hypothetical protein